MIIPIIITWLISSGIIILLDYISTGRLDRVLVLVAILLGPVILIPFIVYYVMDPLLEDKSPPTRKRKLPKLK